MQEQSIFIEALEMADRGRRGAYLDRVCANDSALRERIEKLLERHQQADSFLEPSGEALLGSIDEAVSERPGTVIGPYKLLEQIGEGGFGIVFMAEQQRPVHRKVALKVVKPGMDTRQVVARFEAERQALALMDHPNIAHVFDGGETASGRPYFVMELVRGVPITDFCDQNQLPVRQRLELFVSVCQAVQHAHQKGIIHRDIKPSNVLVTLHDGAPVVKVIDFGIAKATGQRLTDKTLFTNFSQMLGTPIYMSPEQAQMSGLDIDTRTDIYSLGVLLYELLTGTTPFDRERLQTAAYDEILRIIREEEPARPSTRISTLGQAAATVSANRQSDAKKLGRVMRGELDWIVMKALEKDRNRRYESASALAADVERYLHDEPVQACPPSTGYKLRKFASKHRAALATVTAFAGLLLATALGSTWLAIRAMEAEKEARQAERDAVAAAGAERQAKDAEVEQRHKAETAEQRAAEEAAIAKSVNDFLAEDLLLQADSMAQADAGFSAEPNLTVKEALNRAAAKIGDRFPDQPLVEAGVRLAIGRAYYGIGESQLAVPHLERALTLQEKLGVDDPATPEFMVNLAVAHMFAGQPDRAVPLLTKALAQRTEQLGPDNDDTLATMSILGEAYMYSGRFDRAIPLIEQVLAKRKKLLGPRHKHTLISMEVLVGAYARAGRTERALAHIEQTLPQLKDEFGPEHPRTLSVMHSLAVVYHKLGRLDQAVPLFEETLAKREKRLGPHHPATLASKHRLAEACLAAGHFDHAVARFEQSLANRREKYGPDHLGTLDGMHDLAEAYLAAGRFPQAVAQFEQALAKRQENLGSDNVRTLASMSRLADAYRAADRFDDAATQYRRLLEIRRRLRPGDRTTIDTQYLLGLHLTQAGKFDESEKHLLESYRDIQKAKNVPIDWLPIYCNRLADLYRRWGKPEKQKEWAAQLLQHPVDPTGLSPQTYALMLAYRAKSLLHLKRAVEAEAVLRECLAIREKAQPDSWQTFNTKSALGGALLHQQKYAEAEPLLLQGYLGMKQREAKISGEGKPRLAEALERLVQLYDARGQKEEAAKWRKELESAGLQNRGPAK